MATAQKLRKEYDPGTPGVIRLHGPYLQGVFLVDSFHEEGVTYQVDLNENTCTCPHHLHRSAICKHLRAAWEESARMARYICRHLSLPKLRQQLIREDLRSEVLQSVRQVIWERTDGAAIIALLEETFGAEALN
jgi:hypothetical protein